MSCAWVLPEARDSSIVYIVMAYWDNCGDLESLPMCVVHTNEHATCAVQFFNATIIRMRHHQKPEVPVTFPFPDGVGYYFKIVTCPAFTCSKGLRDQ